MNHLNFSDLDFFSVRHTRTIQSTHDRWTPLQLYCRSVDVWNCIKAANFSHHFQVTTPADQKLSHRGTVSLEKHIH